MEFYPPDLPVPQEKRTGRLYLRPLRATDVEPDYDAVMSSVEMLRRWSTNAWPRDDLSLEQDLADLQMHEREHLARLSFTFTVLNRPGTQCLGCVYIQPLSPEEAALGRDVPYAADVGFWVRSSELPNALDEHLLATLRDWFRAEWAFDRVLYTITQQETRQAALFAAAGLERCLAYTLPNGKVCWVFG